MRLHPFANENESDTTLMVAWAIVLSVVTCASCPLVVWIIHLVTR